MSFKNVDLEKVTKKWVTIFNMRRWEKKANFVSFENGGYFLKMLRSSLVGEGFSSISPFQSSILYGFFFNFIMRALVFLGFFF